VLQRGKKSTCVKEVEKIKQRRAQRRATQLAIREQHVHEYDVTVPGWVFEAMIRYTANTPHYSHSQTIMSPHS